jgi:hypothetical protein
MVSVRVVLLHEHERRLATAVEVELAQSRLELFCAEAAVAASIVLGEDEHHVWVNLPRSRQRLGQIGWSASRVGR